MRFLSSCVMLAWILASSAVWASETPSPNTSLDAVKAAADPNNGPPIADAVVPVHHSYSALGPPGPYYPERAERLHVTGVAVIQCKLSQAGILTECTVLAEAPTGYAFGIAMMTMAKEGYLKAQPPAGFTADTPARVILAFPKPK